MEKELNIAEILKDVPKGTKLYSSACGKCELKEADDKSFKISFYSSKSGFMNGGEGTFDKNGNLYDDGECIVFPSKEMRDWSKFAWKRGDVLVSKHGTTEVIFDGFEDDDYITFKGKHALNTVKGESEYFGDYSVDGYKEFYTENYNKESDDAAQTYIKTIEEILGGKLNMETLEPEKTQSEFKDGDIIYAESNTKYPSAIFIYYAKYKAISYACLYLDEQKTCNQKCYTYVGNMRLRYATEKEKQQLFDALAKKGKRWNPDTKSIEDLTKKCEFKPFDKVLARNNDAETWIATLFGFYDKMVEDYICIGDAFKQCIPYEGNESLLGTTKDVEG